MRGSGFGSLTLMLIVAITVLAWSSNFDTCGARRSGRHWRKHSSGSNSRPVSDSLYYKKKAGKSSHGSRHGSGSHHQSSKKPKIVEPPHHYKSPPPTYHKAPSLPGPTPKMDGPTPTSSQKTFNVLHFGAKGDKTTDDTKAFEAAWAGACKVEASVMVIPAGYQFLVGPISFAGPYCQPNIVFQLDGTIIAPTSSKAWGSGFFSWLEFSKLIGITIQGKGVIDGSGSVWWQDSPYENPPDDETQLIVPLNHTAAEMPPLAVRSELSMKMPSMKPTALRFYGSFNVTVTGITIQNSPQCHLKFDDCFGVSVFETSVSSPGDSPNTDGIHLQNSKDVTIRSTNLACGDDCVSIQTGCSNVYIQNVKCGPGHGISIGGLGKDNTKACVSNVTVRDVMMHNTMNGVRIKTWQGAQGEVRDIMFSNIQVSEVQLPIIIDQYYCDKRTCHNQTAAVSVSGIHYENIKGTYTVKAVHLACSDSQPCTDVSLTDIQLKPVQERYHLYNPFCWQAFGELRTPTVPVLSCLQVGKPAKNLLHSGGYSCYS